MPSEICFVRWLNTTIVPIRHGKDKSSDRVAAQRYKAAKALEYESFSVNTGTDSRSKQNDRPILFYFSTSLLISCVDEALG